MQRHKRHHPCERREIPTKVVLFVCLFLIVVPQPVQAQGERCRPTPDLELSIEQAIRACTAYASDAIGAMSFVNRGASPDQRASGYYTRGLLYHLSGKLDLAIADYSAAIGWNHNLADAYEARGDAYADLNDKEKAAEDYAGAARLSSDGPAPSDRCWIRAIRGRPLDRALADCNEALKASPDDKDVLDSRCLVYFKMGNYAAAIADCTAVETVRKRFASSLYVGGLAKLHSGDKAGGEADIAAALDADYRIADTYALYGLTR